MPGISIEDVIIVSSIDFSLFLESGSSVLVLKYLFSIIFDIFIMYSIDIKNIKIIVSVIIEFIIIVIIL